LDLKGIVFDKDGTLFDFNATWGAWTRTLLEVEASGDAVLMGALAEVLGYDIAAQVFRPESIVIASTASEVADVILPFLPPQPKGDLLRRMNAAAALAPQAEATPLGPFIDRLQAASLKIGVATNDAEAPARAHLRAAGVEHRFDFIAGYDSGFGGKPAAGQLLAFCAQVGLAPAACAMVGDSTHDLRAGRAAGMVCVGVLTGVADRATLAPQADVVLDSIADLPAWLGV
jgi:phosphoglycolate phosphatase